ncbi:MAG TPA: FtsX-like permease family protein, partial [Haloplasmataceae bacterium]
ILTNPTELIYGNVNDFFDTVMYILVAASSVSLVVAGILVGLMIYMSVIERVKEIGILTALGARRSNIRALFIFESASIGAVSSLIALSIALTISWIINTIFNNTVIRLFYSLGIFVFENMQLLRIDIITIILVFIIAIVYAVICGLIPAILASRLKAIDALRKE